jgi:hypothetical protein
MPGLEVLEPGIREPFCKERVGPWLHPIMPGLRRCCSPEARWTRCLPSIERRTGHEVGSVWPSDGTPFVLWSWEKSPVSFVLESSSF